MEKILSVVIPSYNVQKYLGHTLDSFLEDASILPQLEILVVNDGSCDDTPKIAASYEERYPGTVRLVNKENGGHGSAINRGIQEARGKYFKVVDGDDWVQCQNLARLMERLGQSEADLVLSPYDIYDENTGKQRRETFMQPFSGMRQLDEVSGGMRKISIHGMVIRTAILKEHQIRLEEKIFYVDVEYVCFPLPYVRTVEYFDASVTVYRIGTNEQSMNLKNLWARRSQHHQVVKTLVDFYEGLGDGITPERKDYVKRTVVAVAEGQYRIYFIGPLEKETKRELLAFDHELQEWSTDIYDGITYQIVKILRSMGFPLFRLVAACYQRTQK